MRPIAALLAAAGCSWAAGQVVSAGTPVANNTPAFVKASTTRNLGLANQSQVIDVSVWLNVHNRPGLDSLYEQLYDKNSSHYRDWVKHSDFVGQYAPTAAEAAQVSAYLTARGLHVTSVGPDNMYVRAQGAVAAVSKAFHVTLNNYSTGGKTIRANSGDPLIEGATAALVRSVSGLDNAELTHPIAQRIAKNATSTLAAATALAAVGSNSPFSNVCFEGVTTETMGTAGSYPYAVYKGNKYNSTNPGCGYTPAEIQQAYGLNSLYREGYDGTGQTIVIIDWCGSPTITEDANAFSLRFGLPPITSSNFQIINFPGPSTCASENAEINLDVEWAHAIAPGAKIVLLVPPTDSFQDIDEAEYHAVVSGLGSVISGSYGAEEIALSGAELANQDLINEIAAVFGVSANFSTGDYGDFTYDAGQPASVSAPAASPYATAVGGISLALNGNNTIKWQTGWGTNETLLAEQGTIYDPPINLGFTFGSGGGPSGFFGKPFYQKNLAGKVRQLPDISWLADPFTGAVVEISQPFTYPQQILEVYGGTSLACPMFSALWAIANQEAGIPLGQAAPYLYSMPKGTITDVLPLRSGTNVTATVYQSAKDAVTFSADQLASPLEKNTTTGYYSAIWDDPGLAFTSIVVTFDTDSGLATGPGWDNVTGLGVPNPRAFADHFNPAK